MDPWKRRFIRDLFPYSASRMHIERAFMWKHPHIPHTLYKYRCFSSNHIEALKKNVLWMSSPDRFNDPYDAAVHFDPDRFLVENRSVEEYFEHFEELKKSSRAGIAWRPEKILRPIPSGEWRRKLTKKILEILPVAPEDEIAEMIEKFFRMKDADGVRAMSTHFRNSFSVLSLSENYSSILMWSHYSNSHTGFAIEYDFSKLGYQDLLKRLCFPVFYTRKPRDATRYMVWADMSHYNNLFGQYMCLIKKDEWAYEKEWRIVHAIGASHANSELLMPKPSAILLGAEVARDDEAMMRAICSTQSIPLKRMERKSSSYDLVAIELRV